jgi:hypothetical protein
MSRFVVLRHETPGDAWRTSHWDLMLEDGPNLATWSLEVLPESADAVLVARRLSAHRLAYLDYEGPVSGNRGHVSRWDAGEYVVEIRDESTWCVQLVGGRLRGRLTLHCRRDDDDVWTVRWDPAAVT